MPPITGGTGGIPTLGTDYGYSMGTVPGGGAPTGVGGGGVPNVGTAQNALGQLINLIAQQRAATLPKQLPPRQVQAGNLSGNYSDTPGPGSNAYNRRVTIAQSIGNLVAGAENRYEEKKARDIAYNASRIEAAMSNPTPENIDMVNKIIYKNGDPNQGLTKEGKDLQQALDINFGMDGQQKSDSTPPFIKKARQMMSGIFGRMTPQQQQRQQAPPPQAQGQGGPMAGAPPMPMGMPFQGGAPPQQPGAGTAGATSQPQQMGAPAQQPQGAPVPIGGVQQQQVRPNTIPQIPAQSSIGPGGNVVPGRDAFGSLYRQMPQVMGLTPQAQLQMELTKAGVLPSGDVLTEQQWKNAETNMRLAVAIGVLQEKDLDRLSRDARSRDANIRAGAIAEINAAQRDVANRRSTAATDYRSRVLYQIADARNTTQMLIQNANQQLKSVSDRDKIDKDIIANKNSTKDQRAAAQKELDRNALIEGGLRTNVTDLTRQYNSMGSMLGSPGATSAEGLGGGGEGGGAGAGTGEAPSSEDDALNKLLEQIMQ